MSMLRLLRTTRVMRCAYSTKMHTGIVGLNVVPNGRDVLTKLYEKTLKEAQKFPKEAHYRTDIEHLANERLAILRRYENVEDIEKHMEAGQIEEVIEDTKKELDAMPDFLEGFEGPGVPIVVLSDDQQ